MPDSGFSGEARTQPPKPVPNQFRSLDPQSCSSAEVRRWPHGGGFDIRRVGLGCKAASTLVPKLGTVLGRGETLDVQDRGNGWTCWGELLEEPRAIQIVCWNGDKMLSYKAG